MIKRQHWAVAHGGGEYGSEDSSDSDLEAEEAAAGQEDAHRALTWAESIAAAGAGSDSDDAVNEYATHALRGPRQTAAIGGFRGSEFTRSRQPIVPEDEDESDGSEDEGVAFESREQREESRKEKAGRQQREARRLKARRKARAQAQAEAGGSDDGAEEAEEAEERKEAKRLAKLERFKEHAEKYAYTPTEGPHAGRVMYRSPLFPDLQIFSAEQLRHHMLTKKYKKAERKAARGTLSAEQLAQRKAKQQARRGRKAARRAKSAKATRQGEDGDEEEEEAGASGAATDGAAPRRQKRQPELTEEQIAAKKARFAAKKARRRARAQQGQ